MTYFSIPTAVVKLNAAFYDVNTTFMRQFLL